MNKFRSVSLFVSFLMLMVSCETDFDINSDWKDITVVYGLIDQTDSVHFIKINKAFLGNGNALQYASVEDSSSYRNNLEVKLIERRGNISNDIIFDTTSVYNKEPGVFYFPHQILYKSTEPLNQEDSLFLKIRNKITGKEISSSTSLIHDFTIDRPSQGLKTFEFKRSDTNEKKFVWVSAVNGKRYQVTIRFFFKESSAPGDTLVRSVEWIQSPQISAHASGGEPMESNYVNEKFFTTCISQIPYMDQAKEANVDSRQVLHVDFIFSAIGDAMNTYLEVNEPSTSVLQDKPEYTNINNGIGIFSCRYSKTRSKPLGQNTELDLTESDDIKIKNLKFVKNPDN
jgi:hypothetical protein